MKRISKVSVGIGGQSAARRLGYSDRAGETGPRTVEVVRSVLVKAGHHRPRKTFYSFRHTLIDDLRDAGVQDSLIKRIAGHEDGSVTFSIYGSRSPLKAMAEAMSQIKL